MTNDTFQRHATSENIPYVHPSDPQVHHSMGLAFQAQGQLDWAAQSFEQALLAKPDYAEACYHLANVLRVQGKLESSKARFELVLKLEPGCAPAYNGLGAVLRDMGRLDEAFLCFQQAVVLDPNFADAHLSESLLQLMLGDFTHGWRHYEWRLIVEKSARPYQQPRWTGEKLESGRLLLWGEQGVGDKIMFAGLFPEVTRTGSPCVLDCADARLQPLFARSFPKIEVVARYYNPGPDIAAHIPMGSLPGLFRPSLESFQNTSSPYLTAHPFKREEFRTRYADGRKRIGLAWQTHSRKMIRRHRRSIHLSLFAPLFAQPDIQWISLQYGNPGAVSEQITTANAPILLDGTVNQSTDIDTFAAQVAAMDLVITVDNSTAHLSAALGIPTWVLLPFAPDWRWFQNREDSPWYPSVRLFRQPQPGEWKSVIQKVHHQLLSFSNISI